jgi:hypothetical protein
VLCDALVSAKGGLLVLCDCCVTLLYPANLVPNFYNLLRPRALIGEYRDIMRLGIAEARGWGISGSLDMPNVTKP